jgi:glycerol transport system ATP-binding protein
MSVALDHVTRVVDGVPTIRDVSLTLERGALSVLLGPTLWQGLDHAFARRS